MKVTGDILNLPVICILEGIEFGKIRDFIIDPDDGGLKYLAIQSECWYSGAQLLPFDKIMGIGINAVTTQTVDDMIHYNDEPEAQRLAGKGICIIGSKVYTNKGMFVGIVEEFYIDEEDGRIMGCQLQGEPENRIIPASKIITYGKNVLIVEEDTEDSLLSAMTHYDDDEDPMTGGELRAEKQAQSQFTPKARARRTSLISGIQTEVNLTGDAFAGQGGTLAYGRLFTEEGTFADEDSLISDDDINDDDVNNYTDYDDMDNDDMDDDDSDNDDMENNDIILNDTGVYDNLNDTKANGNRDKNFQPSDHRDSTRPGSIPNLFASFTITDSDRVSEEPENKAAKLFEQRQRKFLVGRKASKRITTDDGDIIIEDGQLVTDHIIDIIKENGKLIELTMNTKA